MPNREAPIMTNTTSASPDAQRRVRMRDTLPSLAAVLLTGMTVAAAAPWIGPSGWDWTSRGVVQAKALGSDAGQFIVSLCVPNPNSAAMRLWIAQHPKSPRGRLDHQRSNAATVQ